MTDLDNDDTHDIRFSVHVTGYGKKPALVKSIGKVICKELYLQFGDRLRVLDHKSREIPYDPNAHDWGLGENVVGAQKDDIPSP